MKGCRQLCVGGCSLSLLPARGRARMFVFVHPLMCEHVRTSVHVNTSTCVRSGMHSRFRPQDNTPSWPPNRLAAPDRRRPSAGFAALAAALDYCTLKTVCRRSDLRRIFDAGNERSVERRLVPAAGTASCTFVRQTGVCPTKVLALRGRGIRRCRTL